MATRKMSSSFLNDPGNDDIIDGLARLKEVPSLKSLWVGLGSGTITDDGVEYLSNLYVFGMSGSTANSDK